MALYNVIHEISRPRLQLCSVDAGGIETELYNIEFKTYADMSWGFTREEVKNIGIVTGKQIGRAHV